MGSFQRGVETVFLDAIGQRKEFVLSEQPKDSPEEVTVVHRDRPTTYLRDEGFEYVASLNAIRFIEEAPPVGALIRVSYERLDQGGDDGDDEGTTDEG